MTSEGGLRERRGRRRRRQRNVSLAEAPGASTHLLLSILCLLTFPHMTNTNYIRLVVTSQNKASLFGRYRSTGKHCWKNRTCASTAETDTSSCVGGSDRILRYVNSVREEGNAEESIAGVIAIDTGNYFEGPSPLIVFDPDATNASSSLRRDTSFVESRNVFVDTKYDVWGLSYEDFLKTSSSSVAGQIDPEKSVAEWTSNVTTALLEASTTPNPDISDLAPVVTNLVANSSVGNVTARYRLISWYDDETGTNRTVAILQLVDPTSLRVVGLDSFVDSAFMDYKRALTTTLEALRRRVTGVQPDLIVCVLPSVPHSMYSSSNSTTIESVAECFAAASAVLRYIVQSTIGVDLFLVNYEAWVRDALYDAFDQGSNVVTANSTFATMTNWAGDTVGVVPVREATEGYVQNVTVGFDSDGYLTSLTAIVDRLSCDDASNQTLRQYLDDLAASTETTAASTSLSVATAGYYYGELFIASSGNDGEDEDDSSSFLTACPAHGASRVGSYLPRSEVCGCGVSECAAGNLVADSMYAVLQNRFGSGVVDFACAPAFAIDKSMNVTTSNASTTMMSSLFGTISPDMAIVVATMSGASVLQVLENLALAPLASDAMRTAGNEWFIQVSENVYVSWYFVDDGIVLDEVRIDDMALNESATYTVAFPFSSSASSRLEEWIECVGDDPSMEIAETGLSVASALRERLLDPYTAGATTGRIVQSDALNTIQIGILCTAAPSSPQPSEIEECDHARLLVDLLNDKSDGVMDDVLRYAKLNVSMEDVGCVQGLAVGGLGVVRALAQVASGDDSSPVAVIGPGCSTDVGEITEFTARAASGFGGVVVSPSSTAPSLADDTLYTKLARLSTAEDRVGEGLAALLERYSWRKVAVVYTDSDWGTQSRDAFVDAARRVFGNESFDILSETQIEVSAFDALDASGQEALADSALDTIVGVDGRIVFLAAEPRVQRILFRTSYATRKIHGSGFAWITAWISESILIDQSTGSVDFDAVQGSKYVIGVMEEVDTSSDLANAYMTQWAARSSQDSCTRDSTFSTYCDSDGVSTTFGDYGAQFVDSVVALAMGLNGSVLGACQGLGDNPTACNATKACAFLASGGGCTVKNADDATKSLYEVDPTSADLLYASILRLGSFEGVSAPSVRLDATTGDRDGSFFVRNLRLETSSSSSVSSSRRRRSLSVSLESTYATFTNVGRYDLGNLTFFDAYQSCPILFPGETCTAPVDSDSAVSSTSELSDAAFYTIVTVSGAVILGFLVSVCTYRRYQGQKKKMKKHYEAERAEILHMHLVAKLKNRDEMRKRLLERNDADVSVGGGWGHERHHGGFHLVQRWIISTKDVQLRGKKKPKARGATNHTTTKKPNRKGGHRRGLRFDADLLCPRFDGEVSVEGVSFDATIRTIPVNEDSGDLFFVANEESASADDALMFDVDALRSLETISRSRFFPLFIGCGIMSNRRSYFLAFEGDAGSHHFHDLLWPTRSVDIDVAQKLQWILDIVEAVSHLHNHGLVHGNIASFNIRTTSKYLLKENETANTLLASSSSTIERRKSRRQTRRKSFMNTASEIGRTYFGGTVATGRARHLGPILSRCVLEDPSLYLRLHKFNSSRALWKLQHYHPVSFLWQAPEILRTSNALAEKMRRRAFKKEMSGLQFQKNASKSPFLPSWASTRMDKTPPIEMGANGEDSDNAENVTEEVTKKDTLADFRAFVDSPSFNSEEDLGKVEKDVPIPDREPDQDIYAIGVVLYEILTHQSPWSYARRTGWEPLAERTSNSNLLHPSFSFAASSSSSKTNGSAHRPRTAPRGLSLFGNGNPEALRRKIERSVLAGMRPELKIPSSTNRGISKKAVLGFAMSSTGSIDVSELHCNEATITELAQLVKRCWRQNPGDRPLIRFVLERAKRTTKKHRACMGGLYDDGAGE